MTFTFTTFSAFFFLMSTAETQILPFLLPSVKVKSYFVFSTKILA